MLNPLIRNPYGFRPEPLHSPEVAFWPIALSLSCLIPPPE